MTLMARKDQPHRTACGFVLVRAGPEGLEYLCLTNRLRDEPGLPKGHSEPGETELETARRETEEETGLADLDVRGDFRVKLTYEATRKGETYVKDVVYFAAHAPDQTVVLSKEHSRFEWLPLRAMIEAMTHEGLRETIRRAALFLKDPAVCDLAPRSEAAADAYLRSLPEATAPLVAHLRGGARLARSFAEALAKEGVRVNVEATATGTLLHDVGRALGLHDDHQRAGTVHLRTTLYAPYAFGCISHFTKGASSEELVEAGVDPDLVADFRRLVDLRTMTWEERCCALADACMKGATPVHPEERFADLRVRYQALALIHLQETKTAGIRAGMAAVLGRDPLEVVGLA